MKNGDQSAYPMVGEHTNLADNTRYHQEGMTKRELLAAMALQGLLSNSTFVQAAGHANMDHKGIVKISIGMADELLKQLES